MSPSLSLAGLVGALVRPSEVAQLITCILYGVYLGMNYLYLTSDRSRSRPRSCILAINFILLTIIVSIVFAANYSRDVTGYGDSLVLLVRDIALKGGLICSELIVLTSHVQYYIIIYKLAGRQGSLPYFYLCLILAILMTIDIAGLCVAIFLCVKIALEKSVILSDIDTDIKLALSLGAIFVSGQILLSLLMSYVLLKDQPISRDTRSIIRRIVALTFSTGFICIIVIGFVIHLALDSSTILWSLECSYILAFTCAISLLYLLLDTSRPVQPSTVMIDPARHRSKGSWKSNSAKPTLEVYVSRCHYDDRADDDS